MLRRRDFLSGSVLGSVGLAATGAGSAQAAERAAAADAGSFDICVVGGSCTGVFAAVRAAEAISYYGGTVAGIAAIFSTETECMGIPIASIFDPASIPDYISYNPVDCPLCKAGWKVEALVNSHGCSKL